MNIKLQINRVRIAGDALIRGHCKKIQKSAPKKKIWIVFQQIFGDAVVIQNSLESYTHLFPQSKGYRITLLARPSVVAFMNANLKIPAEIMLEELDFGTFLNDYAYYRKIINRYCDNVEMLIVPGSSLSAEIFSTVCTAKRKIALGTSVPVKAPLYRVFFYNRAYNEMIIPEKEDMMLQRHRRLINYLGDKNYKAGLPDLLPKERVIDEAHYCVMCPGSSKMEKCWPTKRYSKIADYIIEKYNMNIHLCGGADEVAFESIFANHAKHPERIISHIGKTSFSDWSAIVQHADLVIGNDSATMHLAAASRKKAICITGVYDKYQFFPYKVDVLGPKDRLPVTLMEDMPCEWCRTMGYNAGFGNKLCAKRIAQNKCASCIDKIAIQDVINQIDHLMICDQS